MPVGQIRSDCELTYLLTLSIRKSHTGDGGTEERLTVRLCSCERRLKSTVFTASIAFLARP